MIVNILPSGMISTIQELYYKADDMSHPFRTVVRLSIVIDILKTPMRLGGAGLKVDRMKLEGEILAFFPKHCKYHRFARDGGKIQDIASMT